MITWGSWYEDGKVYDVLTSNSAVQLSRYAKLLYKLDDPTSIDDTTVSGQFWRHLTYEPLKQALENDSHPSKVEQLRASRLHALTHLKTDLSIGNIAVQLVTSRADFEAWLKHTLTE
jgi:hypothetical protein